MPFPKKLTPDNLRDTLVEIRFLSGIPQELMQGYALSVLAPLGFKYTPTPVPNKDINVSLGESQQFILGFGGGSGFFTKDVVRVQFVGNQIVFNCLSDRYLGWSDYSKVIFDIIESLLQKQVIGNINRISIRYISEFKDVEIFSNIKGNIDISQTGLKLDNSILRLVDEAFNIKTFVAITNKAKRIFQNQIIDASLVDVNVFENFAPAINSLEGLRLKLDGLHLKQKEIFFRLITDEFLQTLNPEY